MAIGSVLGAVGSLFGGKAAKKAAKAQEARLAQATASDPFSQLSQQQRGALARESFRGATEDPQIEAARQRAFIDAQRALDRGRWMESARDTGIGRFAAGGSSGESGAMTRLLQRGFQDYTKESDLGALGALQSAHGLRRQALQDALAGARGYTNTLMGAAPQQYQAQMAAGQAIPTAIGGLGYWTDLPRQQRMEQDYRRMALQQLGGGQPQTAANLGREALLRQVARFYQPQVENLKPEQFPDF